MLYNIFASIKEKQGWEMTYFAGGENKQGASWIDTEIATEMDTSKSLLGFFPLLLNCFQVNW